MTRMRVGDRSAHGSNWIERLAPSADRRQDGRVAWAIWIVFLAVIGALTLWGPRRTVTPAYFFGAEQWLAGAPLYNPEGIGFLYLPQAAVLFTPFALLPTMLTELLWRCVSVGVFVWGFRRLVATAEPSSPLPLFAMASLIAAPLAFSSAKSGQATLPMAGLMLAAIAFQADRSWWRAAACLSLALSIKPLAIVLILLSAAMHRPLAWRLAVALGVTLAIPFLTQRPAYVSSQYAAFAGAMQAANDHSHI
jgi:alpha-1,2-mannosyltransferase